MKKVSEIITFIFMVCSLFTVVQTAEADEVKIKITKKYLNLPVSHQEGRAAMIFLVEGNEVRRFDIRLASEKPDYWVFCDVSRFKNKEITADILLDKTSVKVFIDGGAYSYSMERTTTTDNHSGFNFFGHNIEVKELEVCGLRSVWKSR